MGVYVKGMEMPSSCGDCKAFVCYKQWAGDVGDCFCGITKNDAKAKEKNAGCPLFPVPPHGDLIDRDALEMERMAENAKKGWHDSFAVVFNGDPYYEAIYDCTEQFKELVNNAPTIILAEEGE